MSDTDGNEETYIRLPLERMFEAGFYALTGDAGRRIYKEEIEVGADIDDLAGDISRDEAKAVSQLGEPEEKVISNLNLTDMQIFDSGDTKYFFVRRWPFNNFMINYFTGTDMDYNQYANKADEIVKNGIVDEIVSIELTSGLPGFVMILFEPETMVVHDGTIVRSLNEMNMDGDGRIEFIEALKRQKYVQNNPENIYQAVMDFIR
jgi:hypothetical protein